MNHTMKTLAKIRQQVHLKVDQVLLIALLQIRVVHRSRLKLSPFETVYGRPFQNCFMSAPLNLESKSKIKQYVDHLGQTLTILHKFAHFWSVYPSDEPLHPFEPILTKDQKDSRP